MPHLKKTILLSAALISLVLAGVGSWHLWDRASVPATEPGILTPLPSDLPRINGPRVYGVRPGSPFLFTIAATGERPMTFSAANLPEGLILDSATGRITGVLSQKGEYQVTLDATNEAGSFQRNLKIIAGDKIALTPPMGWSSWNCFGQKVTQDQVLRAAGAMKESGLINHGWSYINIDDGWQGVRGGPFNAIQPNQKFPSMESLVKDIHALGLKTGIYSSPWIGTFAGHIGSYADNSAGTYPWIESGDHNKDYRIGAKSKDVTLHQADKKKQRVFGTVSFVANDVKQWVAWQIDYLKYDWFPDVPHTQEMSDMLARQSRDIVFSISNTASVKKAAEWARLANAWRTTSDAKDTWASVSEIGFSQDQWAAYAGPGHWNDPDMLVVGVVGWGKQPHTTALTQDEQYTHVSLWCLLAAPLVLGCDLEKLDDFTLGLLTNDEVIEVNQDPLGKQGVRIGGGWWTDVYGKPLEDGSWALGLINRRSSPQTITARWSDFGAKGHQNVRDLWRQRDLGSFEGKFEARVPAHGVVLIKVCPSSKGK